MTVSVTSTACRFLAGSLLHDAIDVRFDFEKSRVLDDEDTYQRSLASAEQLGRDSFAAGHPCVTPVLLASARDLKRSWGFGWRSAELAASGAKSAYVIVYADHPKLGRLYWSYCSGADTNSADYYGFTRDHEYASRVKNGWRTDENLWSGLDDGLHAYQAQRFLSFVFDSRNEDAEFTEGCDEGADTYYDLTGTLAALQIRSGQTADEFVRWLHCATWSDLQAQE